VFMVWGEDASIVDAIEFSPSNKKGLNEVSR
jgi:hypothetical protein